MGARAALVVRVGAFDVVRARVPDKLDDFGVVGAVGDLGGRGGVTLIGGPRYRGCVGAGVGGGGVGIFCVWTGGGVTGGNAFCDSMGGGFGGPGGAPGGGGVVGGGGGGPPGEPGEGFGGVVGGGAGPFRVGMALFQSPGFTFFHQSASVGGVTGLPVTSSFGFFVAIVIVLSCRPCERVSASTPGTSRWSAQHG